jgi:hypothetical protein
MEDECADLKRRLRELANTTRTQASTVGDSASDAMGGLDPQHKKWSGNK